MVEAARHRLTIGEPDGAEVLDLTTDSVTFLEQKRTPEGRAWQLTSTLMDTHHALALASYAITEIEALWIVARKRFLGASNGDVVPVINPDNIDSLRRMEARRAVSKFSRGMFTEPPPPSGSVNRSEPRRSSTWTREEAPV